MCKIIGFTNKVDGYQTITGKQSTKVFMNACKTTADKTGAPLESLKTKRQASKFFRGKGVVYQTITRR